MTFTTASINKKLQIVDSVLGYMPLFLPVFLPMLYLCYIFDLPVYFRVAQAHLAGDRPSMTDWESQPVTGTHNR